MWISPLQTCLGPDAVPLGVVVSLFPAFTVLIFSSQSMILTKVLSRGLVLSLNKHVFPVFTNCLCWGFSFI